MKKYLIVLLLILNIRGSDAFTTYVHINLNLQHTPTPGGDSTYVILLKYHGLPYYFEDSFYLNNTAVFNKNYTIQADWTLQYMDIEVRTTSGTLIEYYRPPANFNTSKCDGFIIDKPFTGSACADLSAKKAGIFCGRMTYHAVKNNSSDRISYYDGHWSDPFGIYCEYDTFSYEPPLILKVPCSFNYLTSPSKLHWFESDDGINNWRHIADGKWIAPALHSYQGGNMYNQKRWYKVIVDTNWTKGIYDPFESVIFGPVRFYLGQTPDSIVVFKPEKCNEKTDILWYFRCDSVTRKLNAPRLWVFYRENDSMPEKRWFLGYPRSSPVHLAGHPLFPENAYPAPPDSLVLNDGIYRIRYDFSPWNGFNCKLLNDTVVLSGSHAIGFHADVSLTDTLQCFGDSTAVLSVSVSGSDSSYQISLDSVQYRNSKLCEFRNLGSGNHTIWVTAPNGCEIKLETEVKEPPVFTVDVLHDTTLCKGQFWNVSAADTTIKGYCWFRNSDTISLSDTWSIKLEGVYFLKATNTKGCVSMDSGVVRWVDTDVEHDFLIPSEARLSDTVYTVNVSQPLPDRWQWKFSDTGVQAYLTNSTTMASLYPDTGLYRLEVSSKIKGCTFIKSKNVRIIGDSSPGKSNLKLGYKGPLIQSFTIDPNPNDGYHFTIKIKLRDTVNITILKLDAISGDIIGDIDLKGKDYFESNAFTDAYSPAGVFYLKLLAGAEIKTIKVVVVK